MADDDHEDSGYVEIEVAEAALDDHLRRYREFVTRVLTWKAQPRLSKEKALELIGEHEILLQDVGIDRLAMHLFDTVASELTPGTASRYSAAGVLQATSEFLYHIGKAYLTASVYLVAADLSRMSEGGASLLAVGVQRAKAPFKDLETDSVRRLVLQADYLAGRDGGSWTSQVPRALDRRTLQRWAAERDMPADRARAREIGRLVRSQQELDLDQRAFEAYITRYSMAELISFIINPPRVSG